MTDLETEICMNLETTNDTPIMVHLNDMIDETKHMVPEKAILALIAILDLSGKLVTE